MREAKGGRGGDDLGGGKGRGRRKIRTGRGEERRRKTQEMNGRERGGQDRTR